MLKTGLKRTLTGVFLLATAASLPFGQAFARDLTIQVWAAVLMLPMLIGWMPLPWQQTSWNERLLFVVKS